MIGIQPHFGPGDEVGIAYLVESMRAAAPLIVGTGVASAEEIGMETLEQQVRDEQRRNQAVVATPMLLSAWATIGLESGAYAGPATRAAAGVQGTDPRDGASRVGGAAGGNGPIGRPCGRT